MVTETHEPERRAAEFRSTVEAPAQLHRWLESALPAVLGFVLARCGGNRAVAEDLTQETMVEVRRQRATFDGRSSATTWVCGIARHKVADYYRQAFRDERRGHRLAEEQAHTSAPSAPGTDPRDAVWDALQRLPEGQRVVLAAHYLDGYPVRDIARDLGKSESAVESLLARGRDGFRRAWDEVQGGST